MTTTLIDKRARSPAMREPLERHPPQTEHVAHVIVLTGLALALAKIVAANAGDDEFDGFVAHFVAQCDKYAAQSGIPAVTVQVTKKRDELVEQLGNVHRQCAPSDVLPAGYDGG